MCVRCQPLLLLGSKVNVVSKFYLILSYLILLVQSQQQKQLEKSVKYVQTPELRQCQVIKVGWFFQN